MPSANPNAAELLAMRAALHPERIALIENRNGQRRTLTFWELKAAVARAAARLRQLGVESEDRVLLAGALSLEHFVAVVACWQLGAVAVIADGSGGARVEAAAEVTEPRVLLSATRSPWLQRLNPVLRKISVRDHLGPALYAEARRAKRESVDTVERVSEEHPALITFNSEGSTAIVRSHGFLRAQFAVLQAVMRLQETDIDLPMQPLFGLNNLAAGITTVIPVRASHRTGTVDPAHLHQLLTTEGITTASGPPSLFELLGTWCLRQGYRIPLRAVHTEGGPILPSLARLLRETVEGRAVALFGKPEAQPIASIDIENLLSGATSNRPGVPDGVCAGKPVKQLALKIIHPHPEPIRLGAAGWSEWEEPGGETGEIVVIGLHVLPPQQEDPAAPMLEILEEERRWRRTGEAGRLDAEGRLWLMGSLRQRVRRAGRDWWPVPAETAALAVPPIAHACYLGVPDGAPEQQAYLCVETPGGRLSETQRQRVMTAVAPTPVDQLVVLPQIPRESAHDSRTDITALRALLGGGSR